MKWPLDITDGRVALRTAPGDPFIVFIGDQEIQVDQFEIDTGLTAVGLAVPQRVLANGQFGLRSIETWGGKQFFRHAEATLVLAAGITHTIDAAGMDAGDTWTLGLAVLRHYHLHLAPDRVGDSWMTTAPNPE